MHFDYKIVDFSAFDRSPEEMNIACVKWTRIRSSYVQYNYQIFILRLSFPFHNLHSAFHLNLYDYSFFVSYFLPNGLFRYKTVLFQYSI